MSGSALLRRSPSHRGPRCRRRSRFRARQLQRPLQVIGLPALSASMKTMSKGLRSASKQPEGCPARGPPANPRGREDRHASDSRVQPPRDADRPPVTRCARSRAARAPSRWCCSRPASDLQYAPRRADAHQHLQKFALQPGNVDGRQPGLAIGLEGGVEHLIRGGQQIAKIAVHPVHTSWLPGFFRGITSPAPPRSPAPRAGRA